MFFNFLLDHIINPATFHLFRELLNLGFFRMFIYSCSQPYKITSFHSDHWYNGTSSMLCSRSYSVCLFSLLRLLSSSLRLLLSSPPAPFLLSSSPLLRLLSSDSSPLLSSSSHLLISFWSLFLSYLPPFPLLSTGFFPPLLRLLSSSRPVFLFSSPPLLLSSSYSLLLFSDSVLLFIQVLSSSPAPLLFSGSCLPVLLSSSFYSSLSLIAAPFNFPFPSILISSTISDLLNPHP